MGCRETKPIGAVGFAWGRESEARCGAPAFVQSCAGFSDLIRRGRVEFRETKPIRVDGFFLGKAGEQIEFLIPWRGWVEGRRSGLCAKLCRV